MKWLARVAVVVGAFGVVALLGKVHASVIADPAYDFTSSARFAWSLAYATILVVVAYSLGLPDLTSDRGAVATAALASAVSAVGVSLLQLATGDALLPRFVVFGSALVLVPWNGIWADLAAGGLRRAAARDRILLVTGDASTPQELAAELAAGPERPATLAHALSIGEARTDGRRRPLVESVLEHSANVVVLDRFAQADDDIVRQAATLHEQGIRVRTLGLLYEEWLGKLPLSELERVSMMFDIGELHRARYGRAKRVMDVVLALVGLVPLAIAAPVVVVGDLVGNRGPLVYRQERVGRFGRHFTMLKFRTMRPVAEGLPNEWTSEDDPRITPFGRFLRRTHLDELPQVVNVLRGDLSIVGPRPEQPHYVAELVQDIPFYDLRHRVRPGLTGWAQVKYGYAGDERDAVQKLQYDFYYLRHQDLRLDARVIGRTLRTVVGQEGR
jgi:lipopolysaccharide/colanic/teichoic acid biosynthesis glycosyltransferase